MIALTRNNTYTEELLQLGAAYVINTSEPSLHEAIMELTNGNGATAAIDSIGGSEGTALAFCLRSNSILLTIGLLSRIPVNWMGISSKTKVHIKLFHLRRWNQRVSMQKWQATFDILLDLLQNDRLHLMKPDSIYDLLAIKEAVLTAGSLRNNKGKVLLPRL